MKCPIIYIGKKISNHEKIKHIKKKVCNRKKKFNHFYFDTQLMALKNDKKLISLAFFQYFRNSPMSTFPNDLVIFYYFEHVHTNVREKKMHISYSIVPLFINLA